MDKLIALLTASWNPLDNKRRFKIRKLLVHNNRKYN